MTPRITSRRRHRRRGWARPGSQKANFLSGQGTRCRCLRVGSRTGLGLWYSRRNLGSRRFNRSSLSSRGFELEWFLIRYHNRFNLLRDCQLGPGIAIKDIQLAGSDSVFDLSEATSTSISTRSSAWLPGPGTGITPERDPTDRTSKVFLVGTGRAPEPEASAEPDSRSCSANAGRLPCTGT